MDMDMDMDTRMEIKMDNYLSIFTNLASKSPKCLNNSSRSPSACHESAAAPFAPPLFSVRTIQEMLNML